MRHELHRAVDDEGGLFTVNIVMTSYHYDRAGPSRLASLASPPHGGYGARGNIGHKIFALSLTCGLHALAFAALMLKWQDAPIMVEPSQAIVVELLPLAAPPEPVQEVPEGPQQVEQKEQKPKEEDRPAPPDIVIPQPAPITIPAESPAERVEAADPVPETTAPRSMPAPPANRASSNAEATWEALLLAHLEKYRRYPASARNRGVQGVAYVRFRMNRAGRLLSAEIIRSSGSEALDRAALETLRRAEPLPAIPSDRPDILELSVPVEFFVRR